MSRPRATVVLCRSRVDGVVHTSSCPKCSGLGPWHMAYEPAHLAVVSKTADVQWCRTGPFRLAVGLGLPEAVELERLALARERRRPVSAFVSHMGVLYPVVEAAVAGGPLGTGALSVTLQLAYGLVVRLEAEEVAMCRAGGMALRGARITECRMEEE